MRNSATRSEERSDLHARLTAGLKKSNTRSKAQQWTNDYRPWSWLSLECDIAMTHARFRGDDSDRAALFASLAGFPAAQIGNAPGNYIPGTPNMIASVGLKFGEKIGWFS